MSLAALILVWPVLVHVRLQRGVFRRFCGYEGFIQKSINLVLACSCYSNRSAMRSQNTQISCCSDLVAAYLKKLKF